MSISSIRPSGSSRRPIVGEKTSTENRLRVRTELLSAGGPMLWDEFMAELRYIHLGGPAPRTDGPGAMERLADAYAAAL